MTVNERGEALRTEPRGVSRAGVAPEERERDRRVDRPERLAGAWPAAVQLLAQLIGEPDTRVDEVLAGAVSAAAPSCGYPAVAH